MDYRESIAHLLTLVDLERNRVDGPRQKTIYNLERMDRFLARLGNPHLDCPAIHIAGTKGKGSTAAFCDSTLRAAGLHTGFYSSPHLHTFRERIKRDSTPVTEAVFAGLVEDLWPLRDGGSAAGESSQVTLFEFLTGMAFRCFSRDRVDVQTIEVGLGGRLDATNVVEPQVAVITSISLDHTAVLGDTVGEIAADKAGIIKAGASVVVSPQTPEALTPVLAACARMGADPVLVGRDVTWERHEAGPAGQVITIHGRNGSYHLMIPLPGDYQCENAAAAVAALEAFSERMGIALNPEVVGEGFAQVSWPCRMEVLAETPFVVADGAHNVSSVTSLLASLPDYFPYERLLLVVGMSRDKDIQGMVAPLAAAAAQVFATSSKHPRSVGGEELAGLFSAKGASAQAAATPDDGLRLAMAAAGPNDLILATGSLFLAAEVREAALGIEPEAYPEIAPQRRRAR